MINISKFDEENHKKIGCILNELKRNYNNVVNYVKLNKYNVCTYCSNQIELTN